MRRRIPTPVPPLADAAVSRLERGLFAALDARPLAAERPRALRWRAFAFGGGLAVAVALIVVRDVRRGETLPTSAAQISTTTSGTHIAIAGATLEVAPQSALSFGGRDGAVVVVLDRGTVTCEVAPRSKRAPFIVEAGATRVTVIGTRFSVHRVGEHATVAVEHGLVEVADTNMSELVHAGESYRPGGAITRAPLSSEAPVAPSAPVVTVASTPLVAAPAPPVAELAPARRPHARRLTLAEAAAPTDDAPAAMPAVVGEAPAVGATPAKVEDDAAVRRHSVQVLFELGAQLEVRDPEAALRIYGELASGEDGWAASALFAAARLESERGQVARARELSATYLQRFPRGPNADDARTLLAPTP